MVFINLNLYRKFVIMKEEIIRRILIVSFFINSLIITSQAEKCKINGEPIIKSGGVFNLSLAHCNNDLTITTILGNTQVSGYINIKGGKKIRVIPKDGYSVAILAVPNIDKNNTNNLISRPKNRTKLSGTNNTDRGGKSNLYTIIYPNPVDNLLNIKSNITIINYIILNAYGNEVLKGGSLPMKTTIAVDTFTKGLYHLILQTNEKTITKTFYKN